MEFSRNITAPELGVSPIGLDVQTVPNLGTPPSDIFIKHPLIDAYTLGNKIPLFPPPTDTGSGSGSGTDVVPNVNTDNTDNTDVFTPIPTGNEKTTEQVNYYYPQGSNTPVYTTPSVTPVVIEGNVVGLSKTTKTLLTVGGIVAALFILGVFKNSNVIK